MEYENSQNVIKFIKLLFLLNLNYFFIINIYTYGSKF